MFRSFNEPSARLIAGVLIRRVGIFHREQMPLGLVQRIVAINRDALTHEETMVGFFDDIGNDIWLSEFDKGFQEV